MDIRNGYLKVESYLSIEEGPDGGEYLLSLTNGEVRYLFEGMVRSWFNKCAGRYNSARKKKVSKNASALPWRRLKRSAMRLHFSKRASRQSGFGNTVLLLRAAMC